MAELTPTWHATDTLKECDSLLIAQNKKPFESGATALGAAYKVMTHLYRSTCKGQVCVSIFSLSRHGLRYTTGFPTSGCLVWRYKYSGVFQVCKPSHHIFFQ